MLLTDSHTVSLPLSTGICKPSHSPVTHAWEMNRAQVNPENEDEPY